MIGLIKTTKTTYVQACLRAGLFLSQFEGGAQGKARIREKRPKTGLYLSGLGGLDKAYQDHSKGSLEDVWKLSRPLKWS